MSDFTLAHYKETLVAFGKSGYQTTLMDKHVQGKQLILVHDVDMDVSLVLPMAKIEQAVGTVSTYFFRMGAKNYNLFSRETISVIREIKNMGHDVGYHYEMPASKLNSDADNIQNVITFFAEQTGIELSYFNVHEPARTGIDMSSILPERNRCYNSLFFKDFKYISDSSARWREGCFCGHVEKHEKLLVLTHPFWWYPNSPTENY